MKIKANKEEKQIFTFGEWTRRSFGKDSLRAKSKYVKECSKSVNSKRTKHGPQNMKHEKLKRNNNGLTECQIARPSSETFGLKLE